MAGFNFLQPRHPVVELRIADDRGIQDIVTVIVEINLLAEALQFLEKSLIVHNFHPKKGSMTTCVWWVNNTSKISRKTMKKKPSKI
jgi:hypothetical protein